MINICQELEKDHCRQRSVMLNGCSLDAPSKDASNNNTTTSNEHFQDSSSLSSFATFLTVDATTLRLLSASTQTLEKAELIARRALESLPSRALVKVDDIACLLWKCMPELSLEKAQEIAHQTLERLPLHAEGLARRAWEGMSDHPLDKVEEIARHIWDSVPDLSLEKAEEIARHNWDAVRRQAFDKAEAFANCAWSLMPHHRLPNWMKDNDFLVKGHRPQLNSFRECFKSIFSIHTETGNIWTHLLGCVAFIIEAIVFLLTSWRELQWEDKVVFVAFFLGAILCLGFSTMFHTVFCHSEKVGRLFSKLDYCGISFLTVGSFVPWVYYNFYCSTEIKITYLLIVTALGSVCIFVSLWDGFAEPRYRTLRAGVFAALGLTGLIPAVHYALADGVSHAFNFGGYWSLVLVGSLYLFGATMYAARVPECLCPGKFDIWFQSHQIFHVCVVAAAFVHYYGMLSVASNRWRHGCHYDLSQS